MSVSSSKMIVLLILLSGLRFNGVWGDTDVQGEFFGIGVCSLHRTDTKQVLTLERRLYPEMKFTLCWHFPPWCKEPTGRELFDFVTIPENIKHEILVLSCCPNYSPSKDKLSCVPICSSHCLPNKCLAPSNCSQCEADYYGPTCIPNHFTPNTSTTTPIPTTCSCPNSNFVCTPDFKCVCEKGFDGLNCRHIIPPQEPFVDSHGCSYYEIQVGAITGALVGSAVLLVVLMKKRVCYRNTSEPLLDDSNTI